MSSVDLEEASIRYKEIEPLSITWIDGMIILIQMDRIQRCQLVIETTIVLLNVRRSYPKAAH